jgi:phage terminase large subunit
MGRAIYEQEYLCSFSAAIVGAYFGAEMRQAERDGRIKSVPIDERYPVHCVMDLGKAANNPVWLFQVIGGQLRIVDFYMPTSEDLDDWCTDLRARGFSGNTYVPHDIMVTEWGSGKTRFDRLLDKKMNPRRVTRVSVGDGLQAGRMAINAAVFDREKCELGLNGLRNYRREWDDERKTFRELPFKDWAEHIGSAWRYLGLCWKEITPLKEKKPAPKQLEYTVQPDGTVQGNMSVKEAVDRMVKRRRMMDD